MSSWVYGCKLHLAQGTCGRFELDPNSRGHARGYTGCVACVQRVPANDTTREADREFRLQAVTVQADE